MDSYMFPFIVFTNSGFFRYVFESLLWSFTIAIYNEEPSEVSSNREHLSAAIPCEKSIFVPGNRAIEDTTYMTPA
jgi:hypothetical protein